MVYVIEDLNDEEIIRTCYEKEFESIKQTEYRKEKIIRKKAEKLYSQVKTMWYFF